MKLAIAAGILGQQTILTLSENSTPPNQSLGTAQLASFDRLIANNIPGILHPKSRRRQRAGGHTRRGRPLSNTPSTASIRSCDPLSEDPDVGILSCDPGYECIIDPTNPMGGLCSSSLSPSRKLQGNTCLPCQGYTSFRVDVLNLPIVVEGFTNLTICGDILFAVYYEYTDLSEEGCTAMMDAAATGGCCVPYCFLCGYGSRFRNDENDDTPVNISIEGFEASTCGEVFTAVYDDITMPEEACSEVTRLVKDACCDAIPKKTNCSICGADPLKYPNKQVIPLDGEIYTCELHQFYSENADHCNDEILVRECCGPPPESTQRMDNGGGEEGEDEKDEDEEDEDEEDKDGEEKDEEGDKSGADTSPSMVPVSYRTATSDSPLTKTLDDRLSSATTTFLSLSTSLLLSIWAVAVIGTWMSNREKNRHLDSRPVGAPTEKELLL